MYYCTLFLMFMLHLSNWIKAYTQIPSFLTDVSVSVPLIKATSLYFPLSTLAAWLSLLCRSGRQRFMSVLLSLLVSVYHITMQVSCISLVFVWVRVSSSSSLAWICVVSGSREPQSSIFVQHRCPVIYQRRRWMQLIDCDTAINYRCNRSVMESNSHFSPQHRQAQVNV